MTPFRAPVRLLPSPQVRWETNVRNGVCGVQFDRKDIAMNKFAVTCLEAQFHVFDARTQHPKKVGGLVRVLGCYVVRGCNIYRPAALRLACDGNWLHSVLLHTARGACSSTALRCACSREQQLCGEYYRPSCHPLQGFASVSEKITAGATVWGVHHLPQVGSPGYLAEHHNERQVEPRPTENPGWRYCGRRCLWGGPGQDRAFACAELAL